MASAIIDQAERLCATLERIGDALVALDPTTLLETEETLGLVLAAFHSLGEEELTGTDRDVLRARILRAATALVRCRRLGASFSGVSADVLTELTNLTAALNANDTAAIADGVAALQRAFDRAVAAQGRVGNDLRSIEDVRTLLADAKLHAMTRLSQIEDYIA